MEVNSSARLNASQFAKGVIIKMLKIEYIMAKSKPTIIATVTLNITRGMILAFKFSILQVIIVIKTERTNPRFKM
jgi:hypothetical protein